MRHVPDRLDQDRALLLVVDAPVDEPSLATALHQTPSRIRQTLHRMSLAYTAERRGIDLRRGGNAVE